MLDRLALICTYALLGSTSAFASVKPLSAAVIMNRAWVASHAITPSTVPSKPEPNDYASNLVDIFKYDNLAQIEAAGLLAAKLPASPWSAYYWPIYAGQLANRFADHSYHPRDDWRENKKFLDAAMGKGEPKLLSPAEKYDILVGDAGFTLTHAVINGGAPYADERGVIPTWFGICHGWAPAAMSFARPTHSIDLVTPSGGKINFTPTDIKALGSLLWANSPASTRYIGGRCEIKNPPNDRDARETDPNCLDTNPATWHMVVVNQIGVAKRSFILDASKGNEVWNQPAYSYSYHYRNPITKAESNTLVGSSVALKDYDDPYKPYRTPNTRYIVDIEMKFDYVGENRPSTDKTDSTNNDMYSTVYYDYDLELDDQYKIIGGEWHTGEHPDFLWLPVKGLRAVAYGDRILSLNHDTSEWQINKPIPPNWSEAITLSSESEQPIAKIVERLFDN